MIGPQLVVVDANEPVWRVGFKPEPWAWSGWEWAGSDGRFDGRWDDSQQYGLWSWTKLAD